MAYHTAGLKDGDVITLGNDVLRDDAGMFEDFGVGCQMTVHVEKIWARSEVISCSTGDRLKAMVHEKAERLPFMFLLHHCYINPLIALLILLFTQPAALATDNHILRVGDFSSGVLAGWENKSFSGETDYRLVLDKALSHDVLRATSHKAASGLFRKVRVDLEETPWLHWSWKTNQLFSVLNEREKSGDDFVARLYIVIDGGRFFWRTWALNYIWSSDQAEGQTWPNPFTSNATMFVVESGAAGLGKWEHYSRNLREDLRKLTGRDERYIDAVAIMTDSDNTGGEAVTYYGDIFFTSQP